VCKPYYRGSREISADLFSLLVFSTREKSARNIRNALIDSLDSLEKMSLDKLLDTRYQRLMSYGKYIEA